MSSGIFSDLKQKVVEVAEGVSKRLAESKEKCGSVDMAYIPEGPFRMGSEVGDTDERPAHEVFVSAFCADRYEATIKQFKDFLMERDQSGIVRLRYADKVPVDLSGPKQPAVRVSFENAGAYCKSKGKRLPTEAEWEKMAKGGVDAVYATPDNTLKCGENANCDSDKTTDVDTFLPNPFGVYGLTGGVLEWTEDWWGPSYDGLPSRDPVGSKVSFWKVLRGGAWPFRNNKDGWLRVAFRNKFFVGDSFVNRFFVRAVKLAYGYSEAGLEYARNSFGVRCVRSVETQ